MPRVQPSATLQCQSCRPHLRNDIFAQKTGDISRVQAGIQSLGFLKRGLGIR